MIPKIIHYCWFGGNPLPEKEQKCIASWRTYCPDYEIIEWNENNFDINQNMYIKQAADEKRWAFVSDFARLDIIYRLGGIYLDTDVEIIRNLHPLLRNKALLVLRMLPERNIVLIRVWDSEQKKEPNYKSMER